MRSIKLTQGLMAIVDDEDYEKVDKYKWCAHKNHNVFYAKTTIRINNKYKTCSMHRVIMNAQPERIIDHINGDGLDNRKANLRSCVHQQNTFNRMKPQKNNRLGIKGVSSVCNKFTAQIKTNGKSIYLGSFSILGDADSAYRFAEEKYFGKFARTHLIGEQIFAQLP